MDSKVLYIDQGDENDYKHRGGGFFSYLYSDGLFEWFWDNVIYFGDHWAMVSVDKLNRDTTKQDNKKNGCRIWSKGMYCKYYDTKFVMKFSAFETEDPNFHPYMVNDVADVVDFYYSYISDMPYEEYLKLTKIKE